MQESLYILRQKQTPMDATYTVSCYFRSAAYCEVKASAITLGTKGRISPFQ